MEQYQVIYTKNQPLTTWKTSKEEAVKLANEMKKQGYHVSIYTHTKAGSKPLNWEKEG